MNRTHLHDRVLELKEMDWHIEQNESGYTFGSDLHPYFAKFSSRIPEMLILSLSDRTDTVLDPFCGSGTTLVEGLKNGRNVIGVDANPIACLISRCKTNPPIHDDLKIVSMIEPSIRQTISRFYGQTTLVDSDVPISHYTVPEFTNRDKWFQSDVLNELAIIKSIIDKVQPESVRDFLLVTFSSIINRVSNQQSESRYSCKKKDIGPFDTCNAFFKKLKINLGVISQYVYPKGTIGQVINADTRKVELDRESVDLLVTSPPYLNAWDYHLYQRFRLFWLGYKPTALRDIEIGTHLRHAYINNSVERYHEDMQKCFSKIIPAMKKGAYICFVNGRAVVKEKRVNTSDILVKIAQNHGCDLRARIERPVHGPNYGRKATMKTATTRKKEDILIFERTKLS